MMKALYHWQPYLAWTKEPFTILTDHANFTYWKAPRKLDRRHARWHADLEEYNFEMVHILGSTNGPANALSCPPGTDKGENDNQDVMMIPPHCTRTAITLESPSDQFLRNVLQELRNHPTARHPGRDETLRKIKELYQWPKMNQWITDYIKGCATCQQNKIQTHKRKTPPFGITTMPDMKPFSQIAMDLITGLPQANGKDTILTIVDHGCSRAAIFIPCTTTITGPGIAQLYLRNVYPWFGLLSRIISDRDPRFTSQFGKALTAKLGINRNTSTAFHPQTDGLLERKNQWIEQYLQTLTSANPEDWTQWVALALAVHNNRRNTTTGQSPNQILIGYEPQLTLETSVPSNNDLAEEQIRKLIENRDQATKAINEAAKGNGTIPSQYHIGNQVWLKGRNLKFPHQATKLNPKRYGPFKIIKEISPVAYQLQLPPSWNIHPVFHASLLLSYSKTPAHGPNFSRPPPDLINNEEEYEVEQIKAH